VYAGIAISLLSSWHIPVAQTSTVIAAVTALGGVALAAVALWLEALCRIKGDDDEDHGEGTLDVRGLTGGAEHSGT
jgi:hypothetical protein